MDLKELSSYVTSLLRSDAEIITAFLMGVFLTAMVSFWVHRWAISVHRSLLELARKEARVARRGAELAQAENTKKNLDLARKDVQIAGLESRLTTSEAKLIEQGQLVAYLTQRDAILTEQVAAMESLCAELKAENDQLQQIKRCIEAEAVDLRTKLSHALDEVNHWAKWTKVFDEENARLAENGSLREV